MSLLIGAVVLLALLSVALLALYRVDHKGRPVLRFIMEPALIRIAKTRRAGGMGPLRGPDLSRAPPTVWQHLDDRPGVCDRE